MEFFVECLGAAREVGRSAFLVHTDKNILLDYGIKLFDKSGEAKTPLETPLEADFAVLSHAHLDHSGCIPSIYRETSIRWYATPPTKDICEVLWNDSLEIMGDAAPYGPSHLKKALKYWSPLLYKQAIQSGETKVKLLDAGHIAGAAMVELEYMDRTLLYTGDFKCEETFLHKGAKFVEDVDVLMIESTYAEREHPPRKDIEGQLMKEIKETLEEGGNVLLPAFALGRTQELMSIIRHHDKTIPVFVDGMGREITKIYLKYPTYIKEADAFRRHVRSVRMVETIADKQAATKEPSVIISSSGMMNGGPVLNYLFNLNSRSKLILTGYCVEETNGWSLLNEGYITKDGQKLEVDIPVEYLDLSAHAGRSELLKFIKKANPEKLLLIHGDNTQQFAKEMKEEGFDALAPLPGERIMLPLA